LSSDKTFNPLESPQLNFKKIFYFWIPLAATWLMMSVEGPFLAAIIARMAEPKINLAAYGVAFAFALIAEAPVIMILSASTALVTNKHSYFRLRNFTYSLNFTMTVLMIVLLLPAVFEFIAIDLIQLPQNVTDITYSSMMFLLPWPAAIGYRRFFHGILIKNNLTKKVAVSTVIRLISMTTTALFCFIFTNLHGAEIGAVSLSGGVIMEAIAARIFAFQVVKNIQKITTCEKELSLKFIYNFYYPLALTAILTLGVHPIVTFFIGQSHFALESLAVLPVVNSLVFIFRSFGLSYQEVGIALMGNSWENYKQLRNFGFISGLFAVGILLIIAFTPLSYIWFNVVSGLSEELSLFSIAPLMIMGILPGLTYLISFQRAILVYAQNTKPITMATLLEVIVIIISMLILVNYFEAIGAVAAGAAYILGRLVANFYLIKPYTASINSERNFTGRD